MCVYVCVLAQPELAKLYSMLVISIDRDQQEEVHTPVVLPPVPHVSHTATEHLSLLWGEGRVSGQVVVPVLLEGQVTLRGFRYFLPIP